MTTGTVLEAIDNTALTTGKLVHLKTNSTVATNPVLMEFKELTTGKAAVLHVDGLTDGVGFEINTNSGDALEADGKVVSIVANSENHGTMLDIQADDLVQGTGMKITGGTALTTGSLLHIVSGGTAVENGVVFVEANAMTTGTVMKLSAEDLTSGKAVHVVSEGTSLDGDGKLVSIEANSQTSGTLLDIQGTALTNGTALNITSGTALESGSLMHLVTTGTAAANGVLRVDADTIATGKVVAISSDNITTGTILDIETTSPNVASTTELVHLHATEATAGTMVDLHAPKLLTGKVLSLIHI